MPKFTPEQLAAIHTTGQNLLISAAAGSGKTAVLVERIATLLAKGASIDRMLIVTYTKAAAAEMRSRIDARLRAEAPTPHIRRQLALLDGAQIKTLHSFCAWLLKTHFLPAGLPPAFRVDDGPGMGDLRARTMRETLDEALSDEQTASALMRLERVFALEELLDRTSEFLLCQIDPSGWAEGALSGYRAMLEDFSASAPAAALRRMREATLDRACACIEAAMDIAASPDGPDFYLPTLESDLIALDQAREGGTPEFVRLSGKGTCDTAMRESVKNLRKRAKKLTETTKEKKNLPDPVPTALELLRMEEMLPSLQALLQTTLASIARFEEEKVRTGRLTFSDLEHRALRALRDPEARGSLRAQFDHILIDEYQDANPIQEALLSAIAREDNRFMVGDVKQSIYRFRMADPTVFLQKQADFGAGEGGLLIDLNRNFRSAQPVLDAVNHIFSRAMRGPSSEVQYDEAAALRRGRPGEGGAPVDLLLIDEAGEDAAPDEENRPAEDAAGPEEGDPIEEMRQDEIEAAHAAQAAAALIGTTLPGRDEPVRPRDIAVLLRAARSRAAEFQRAFQALGIPIVVDVGGALFDSPEVAALADLLGAIDNRRRDIPLLGAMRSFGGFSLEELARIRLSERKGPLSDAAFARARTQDELGGKLSAFLGRLLAWRERARLLPLPDFLSTLLEETRYERLQSLAPDGARRTGNLRAFLAMASKMREATLGEFVDAMERRRFAGGDTAAVEPPEGEDAVRLMTVHKSKGLEFPVVIGCGLGKRINPRDTLPPVLLHRDLGIASRWVDETFSVKSETPARAALAGVLKEEGLNEELRILYVMMTRAREKLILTGCVKKLDACLERWSAAGEGIFGMGMLLDAIGPALLRHPDGAALRERVAAPPSLVPHPAKYSVRVVFGALSAAPPAWAEDIAQSLGAQEAGGQDIPEALAARLAFRPAPRQGAAQKTSVTAAARAARPSQRPPALPVFLEGTRESPAAQRGLAMHAVLRALDLPALRGLGEREARDALRAQVDAMRESRLLTERQAGEIRIGQIVGFLSGDVGRAALEAETLLREQPFNLRIDDGEAMRLMQGVIDLCFVGPDGGWTVVDYKTDRYHLEPEAVRERHGQQLRSYARALEALTGRQVSRRLVYLFHSGEAVEIGPDPE